MTAVIRSLADSLRRFGDDRLEALLVARPDLAAAVSSDPATIAPSLERLITLAIVWGEDELHLLRPAIAADALAARSRCSVARGEAPSRRSGWLRVAATRFTA